MSVYVFPVAHDFYTDFFINVFIGKIYGNRLTIELHITNTVSDAQPTTSTVKA